MIFMVNMLVLTEFPSESLLHHETMFELLLASSVYVFVHYPYHILPHGLYNIYTGDSESEQ